MNRRAIALGAIAASSALVLTACGSDDTSGGGSGSSASATGAASSIKCDNAKGQLLSDGSSAQKNAIDAWVAQFSKACGVQINYKAGGSGAGVTSFTQGQLAFPGSDPALKPEEVRGAAAKSTGVLRELGPDIQWVESFITADKMFCVYLAKDEAIVQKHAELSGFPASKVTEVTSTIDNLTGEG